MPPWMCVCVFFSSLLLLFLYPPALKMHQKLPTRQNVKSVLSHFTPQQGIIYLSGQVLTERDDTDVEQPFRQESNFFYVTGVPEPGFHVIIDIITQHIQLIAPNVNPDDVMWMGMPDDLNTLMNKYDVDEVLYVYQLEKHLEAASTVYTLPNTKHDFSPSVSLADTKALSVAFGEARAVKKEWEVALIRHANTISSNAHIKLMQTVEVGSNENQLYALFLYESVRHNARFQAYYPIVGVGMNAATLHYNKNNAPIQHPTDLVLVDAGAEYNCYASDITRVFPVGGKFTPEAAAIYTIVLNMQKACLERCRAGVPWEEVHQTAVEVACQGLVDIGILVGDQQEIMDKDVVAAFYPHGVGHMLGLDVHDVAGYPAGVPRIDRPGYRYLRMRRNLVAGNVVTVEPGLYFCDFLIDPVLQSPDTGKYICKEALAKYKSTGGVRIEDNIVITEHGYVNLTTVPKEIEEIEAIMAATKAKTV
ncbi:peptidase M24, structural domain-containing protein [Spinellus fusiger]|nr:peptidase M24, structural domain-containing protein [Spinellus fusiger]